MTETEPSVSSEPSAWGPQEDSGLRRRPAGRPALVAVAHPHEERRAWLSSALARDGHRVVGVSDGHGLMRQLGLWEIQGRQASLVVMAQRLRAWRGDDVARSLGSSELWVPSVLVLDADQAALRDRDLGAAAVFVWPCDQDDLRTVAFHLIRHPRRRRRRRAS